MNPFELYPISFPDLGITVDPPSVAFTLFGMEVKWYGIIITIGFLLAILYSMKRSKEFGIDQDSLVDILLFAVPAALIGARLYFVLFNLDYYLESPLRIFNVREGGLAIYGGIIFSLVAGVLVARIKKIKPGALLDLAALGFLIGQAIGRWGNFVNREAFGSVTTLPWRMQLGYGVGLTMDVHPCFLYESLWNLIGFLLLHLYSPKRRYDGELFLMYVAWYGAGRGFIEMLRTDSLYIPGTQLPISLVLGFTSALVAIALLVYNRFRSFDPAEMQAARFAAGLAAAADAAPESGEADTESKLADLNSDILPEDESTEAAEPPAEENGDSVPGSEVSGSPDGGSEVDSERGDGI